MCVFLSLRADKAKVEKRFDARYVEDEFFGPTFIASAFEYPKWAVVLDNDSAVIKKIHWGLIPAWVKDRTSAENIRKSTVNARAETLFEKPSFREAAKKRHCLILADGFFEFQEKDQKKFPHFIRMKDDEPFAIAGLYENWVDRSSGETIPTFSLITTDANPLMQRIHNTKKRMPVILAKGDEEKWLDTGALNESIFTPFCEVHMEAWPVSRLITMRGVNRNVPEVIEPHSYPELAGHGTLF